MKFKAITLAAALAVATLTTGCATSQQTGTLVGAVVGAAIGGPIGGVAAAHWAGGVVGAIIGGVIGGSIGKHMDDSDQRMAVMSVKMNETKTWTNTTSNNTYTVTPKDNNDGTSTVKTEMVTPKKITTTEVTKVKKPIKE